MNTILNIAKKAFREGSNIYGEKIIGYVSSKLKACEYQKNHYTITLKLIDTEGRKCNTMIGFDLVSSRNGNESFCNRYGCEPSPYGYYFHVISGHVVFTIPITEDMLDLFPMGLNKKPLDAYSIDELEARVLELKRRKFYSSLHEANSNIHKLRESLGLEKVLVNVSRLEYRDRTEEDEDLPFR